MNHCLLDDPQMAWVVQSGKLALFATKAGSRTGKGFKTLFI
jgi:hypothetical protein